MTRSSRIAVVSLLAFQLSALHSLEAQTLNFSGYTWTVKSGDGLGPGPNNWSAANAWVDTSGYLHLRLNQVGGKWYAASVEMAQSLGFGTYQFWVVGAIDTLDKNVVLGLFNYTTPDVGPDGTNEIDIEFARWGESSNPNLSYAVWPAVEGIPHTSKKQPFSLSGSFTTHRFRWESTGVLFQSLHGHRDDNVNQFANWCYYPLDHTSRIPQEPLVVHLNLWLFQGKPPSNGQEVNVVIRKFTYTP